MGRGLNSSQLVTGVVLLICLSTAVSGTSKAATSQTSSSVAVDSCTAITQSEAGAALGQAARVPVRGKATVEGGIACVFYGPAVPAGADPDVPVPGSVRVVLVRGAQARSFFADYRGKVHAVAVPGLGDQAYYDGYASLSVLKGEAYIRIAVIGVRNVLDVEKMLAADALPRM
jgi:lipopolysaccharide export system protein LptA